MKNTRYQLISITGNDKPGIIAAVTGILYRLGCNLEDISMTLLGGRFSMMLLAALPKISAAESLKKNLAALPGLQINFSDISPRRLNGQGKNNKQPLKYVLTLLGNDQTGIVHRVSKSLAIQHINITDLQTKLIQSRRKKYYSLLMEIEVPLSISRKSLAILIKKLASELAVDIRINRAEPLTL